MTREGKICAVIVLIASLFLIFRGHYYPGLPLFAAYGCVVLPIVIGLEEILWFRRDGGFVQRLVSGLLGMGLLILFFFLNDAYCNYALNKKSEMIYGRVVKTEARSTRHGLSKIFVYEYTYGKSHYCNEDNNDKAGFVISDSVLLRVSAFDPTVTEVLR